MRFNETRELLAVLLPTSKSCKVGMPSDIYELIWYTSSLMMDNVELYILILVYLTMTLLQGHRSARKQNFCVSYLTKIWITLLYC